MLKFVFEKNNDSMCDRDNPDGWKTIHCEGDAPAGERVGAMERAFDRSVEVNRRLMEDLEAFERNAGTVKELAKYMDSGLWRRDFEADEAGELPADLKRGVLSEDGLYDLLTEYEELRKRLVKLGRRLSGRK